MKAENNFKQTEIGLIPEDWEVVRLGEVAKTIRGVSWKKDEANKRGKGVPVLTIPNVESGKINFNFNYFLTKKIGREKLLCLNDIVFVSSSGGINNIGRNAFLKHFPFDERIAFASFVAVLRVYSDKIEPLFLYFLINSKWVDFTKFTKRASDGKYNFQMQDFVKNTLIPLPPLEEQRKIAKVLDKIQQAIEIQDRIIEQAKNLKKSLMQKLFTEGLYGEELKETEIGLIPKSWEVVRLGEVAEIKLGRTPERKEKKYWQDGSIPWVKIQDLNNGIIYDTSEKISEIAFKEKFKGEFVPKGTLLLSFKLTIGKVGILGIDAVHHEGIASLCLKEEIVSKKFLFYLFQTLNYEDLLDTYVKGKTLNKEKLSILPIPLPPLEEQKQIARILSTVDKKIEIEQKRKEVLKELFKTMLYKLMSGEIRLKEVEV